MAYSWYNTTKYDYLVDACALLSEIERQKSAVREQISVVDSNPVVFGAKLRRRPQ